MGLAASQARLLLLTARKDDLEGKMMSIANQKLSLSREASKISTDYNNALNATKLTWTLNDGTDADLNYDLLMRPNGLNNEGKQYLLTNAANGKVILDNKYMTDLGLNPSGNPGDIENIMDKSQFLQKLMGITEEEADKYVKAGNTTTSIQKFTTSYKDSDIIKAAGLTSTYGSNTTLAYFKKKGGILGGIFGGNSSSGSTDTQLVMDNFNKLFDNVSKNLSEVLEDTLLADLGARFTEDIEAGLQYASTATYNKFVGNILDADSTDGGNQTNNANFGEGDCEGQNRITVKTHKSGNILTGKKKEITIAVDNSQLINTFLTFFDKYCAENFAGTCASTVGSGSTKRASTGGTGTETDDYTTPTTGGHDVNNNNVNDAFEASFYLNVYDALDSYGWQTSQDINNPAYLQNQILYGNISIKEMKNHMDGSTFWSTLSSSSYDSPLSSKSDEEAIRKAEGEYDAAKNLLTSKEAKLDLTMENLDSERSAINTEMDSVNNIIKKNIENSFKMFQNA